MKYRFVPVMAFVLVVSCAKEKSLSQPKPRIDPIPQFSVSAARIGNSSKLLRREVSFSLNNPLLKKVRIFSYDDLRRCTDIRIGTIDSSQANPSFVLSQSLTFYYSDPSSLLPASLSSVKTIFPNLTTTFYYQYNAQGRKVKDSVRVKNQAGDPADRVVHYAYGDDYVYTTPTLTGFPMENNTFDTLSLLSGGNIEKQSARMIKATGDQFIMYTYTYDQAISPYNKLNIANSLYFESPSLGLGYNVPLETHYMGVTTNNLRSWTSGSYTVTFSYVYDIDLYPVKKNMYLPSDASPFQVTYFEY